MWQAQAAKAKASLKSAGSKAMPSALWPGLRQARLLGKDEEIIRANIAKTLRS